MCMFVNLDEIGTKMKLIPTIPELQVLDIPEFKINLDYINMPQKSSFVKAIEDKFDAIYVGEFPAMAQPEWYTSVPCRVFFSKNPDYAKKLTSVTYNGKTYNNIHKDVKDSLLIVLKKLDDKKLLSFVQSIDSGWYVRDVRNEDGNLSGHAFALSIDVNSSTFPQGDKGFKDYENAIKAGDKKALVVKEFIDSNLFNWGGNFTKTKDAHHFTIKPYNI